MINYEKEFSYSSHMIQLIILEIIPLIEDKEVRRLQNLSSKTIKSAFKIQ